MNSIISRQNIARLIDARSAATPQSLALAANGEVISYLQLEERSNKLANYLLDAGLQTEQPVGLFMDRSPAAVIGALGIMKAGGAYVPLDPAHPAERLAFLQKDANLRVVISDSRSAARWQGGSSTLVVLDQDPNLDAQPITRPLVEIGPDQLAYVMYTSGSTGVPKGVAVTHANVINLIEWHNQAFQVTSVDRASQVASFGFDAAVWETWPHLAAGASLHFAPNETRTEPESLRDWLIQQAITISFVPTALAEHMLPLMWPAGTPLRYFLTGADTLRTSPGAALPFIVVNNYGPTECTVVATSGALTSSSSPGAPPIGRPILNTRVYIVDESLRPVPFGEAGELLIGGAGVARGYLNSPDLTAERFIRDPFSNDPGARLYRTGDSVRYLSNGEIAFLGRLDNQIKIRGYRIEPEEIAAALRLHPSVRSAVVVAKPVTDATGPHGEKQLVAYLTGETADASTLREFARTRLPEYMVPSHCIWLERFPVTLNGKIDYAALPNPVAASVGSGVEDRLCGIVASLVGVPEVHRDDNFFLLGGHSLLGAQMIARIREAFGVDLTLRKLFQSPTVAALSAAIESSQQTAATAK